jgi:hypothetical protein
MKYNTQFNIHLRPHGKQAPVICCGFNNQTNTLILSDDVQLFFDIDLPNGSNKFVLEFTNKTNDTPDMAVEIVAVTFEGMTLDRFKWASQYYPKYPEPWASEQTDTLPEFHTSATYLGWNGRWELEFGTPIFTWIHRLENLGWIYS